jgi:serine/threonine-protein kinase
MGPEQVRGKPLDKRADVFAVGVILYELTTGRRLFRGTDVQIMTQIVEQDVPPPTSILNNYPAELEQVVLNALARDRARRTPSSAHLALALDQFCMRHGLVTGPLVIAHYVRTLFPYEQASEEGMGIAQVPSPGSAGSDAPRPSLSAEELEERLLAEELRELQQRRTAGAKEAARERAETLPPPSAPASAAEPELEELSADDLLLDEPEPAPSGVLAQLDASPDRLRIDEFDEDSEVKPVVLLSPKRKPERPRPTGEGAFMSDLERRLREDAES